MNHLQIITSAVYAAMKKKGYFAIRQTELCESPFTFQFQVKTQWLEIRFVFDTATGKLASPSTNQAELALRAIGVEVDLQEKPKAIKAKRKAGK